MRLLNNKNTSKKRRVSTSGGRIGPTYYASSPKSSATSPFKKKIPVKKSQTRFSRRVLNLALLLVIAAIVIFCLILKPNPKTVVNSSAYHPASVYKTAADNAFKAFRNKTKLTLDEKGVIAALKKQFPEIDSVKIDVPIISQIPTLRITIAAPTFNFSSSNKLYIMGSNGVISRLSSELAGAAALPTVIDQSGFSASPGKQVLGTETIAFINTLLAQCARAGVKVQSLTLPAAAQELDLRVQNQTYYVKFYLGGDALNQAGQYLAAKHKFDSENSQPQQYLDVRVTGKVFYK